MLAPVAPPPDLSAVPLRPAADWQQLVRVALLGTRQSPDVLPPVPGLTAPIDPDEAHREKHLLLAAGALSAIRKAGYQPTLFPTATVVPPAPAETLAALGPTGAQSLNVLLEGQYAELLPNFLAAMAEHQRRVPHPQLVYLLEYVRTRSALHPAATAVLGQRGAWLAAQNPDWQPVLAASTQPDEGVWETGSLRQRVWYLEKLRRQHPAQALELLMVALPQEPAKNQAALLATLRENPSPDDAALLGQYLASKSKEVRQTVLPLLVRRPNSPLPERLWQRAEPLVQLKRNLLNKKLLVELPAANWDKTWLADGIEQRDARFQGEKAALLGQLLILIPPARWAAHWNLPPVRILELAATTEWAELLFNAWSEAAILHHDAEWAGALLHWLFELPRKQPFTLPLAGLTQQLTPQQLLDLALPLLDAAPEFGPEVRWLPLLQLIPAPWPERLTRRVVEVLRAALSRPERLHRIQYAASQLLEHMGRMVPAAQYDLCAQPLQPLLQDVPYLHNSLARLLNTIHFRRQLDEALNEPPGPG